MSGFHHIIEKIVADNGPVHFLAKQVYDEHVSGLQHVDGGLFHQARKAVLLGLCLGYAINIGAKGHELNSEGAPYHSFSRIQDLKAVRILNVEASVLENCPDP